MELKSEFADFLTEIRPTKNQRDEMKSAHETLRERLRADGELSPIIVTDFLQGSYRRHTATRPRGNTRSDVDIIIVTKLDEEEYSPARAMEVFEPFLKKHYKGKWRRQGRSLGIDLSHVSLDLVITSAPSEAELGVFKSDAVTSTDDLMEAPDWRLVPSWLSLGHRSRFDARDLLNAASSEREWALNPLRIPDRDARCWDDTHPLEQIRWTRDKNALTDRHFVNVVKSTKWWRLEMHPETKHPKGFPLERMVGDCCPDAISSVAEGIVLTLEAMVSKYKAGKPVLPDYGVPHHDVLARITASDFATFYEQAKAAAGTARSAFDSTDRAQSSNLWRQLLGTKFPKCDDEAAGGGAKGGGFQEPSRRAVPGTGRFA